MGTFVVALQTVFPLFLVIVAGAAFSHSNKYSNSWTDVLNAYALYIGFPALVLVSLLELDMTQVRSYAGLAAVTSVYVLACMLLAFPLARLFRMSKAGLRTLFLILPFGNFAYLGIPVLQSAYGDSILPVAAILSAVYLFWLLTLGIVLVEALGEEKPVVSKMLLSLVGNPLLLSVFAGLLLAGFQIRLPGVLLKTLHLFSGSVTAIVLFALGLFLGTQKLGSAGEWLRVAGWVVLTMLVLPALYYFFLHSTAIDPYCLKASVLDAAMPLGLTPYILTVQYRLESTLAARIVVLGTMLSVLILSLWISFLA